MLRMNYYSFEGETFQPFVGMCSLFTMCLACSNYFLTMYYKIVPCVPKSVANWYVQIKTTKLTSSFYSFLVRKKTLSTIFPLFCPEKSTTELYFRLPISMTILVGLPDILILFLNIISFSLACFWIFYSWNHTVSTLVCLALFTQFSALEIYSDGRFIPLSRLGICCYSHCCLNHSCACLQVHLGVSLGCKSRNETNGL